MMIVLIDSEKWIIDNSINYKFLAGQIAA